MYVSNNYITNTSNTSYKSNTITVSIDENIDSLVGKNKYFDSSRLSTLSCKKNQIISKLLQIFKYCKCLLFQIFYRAISIQDLSESFIQT